MNRKTRYPFLLSALLLLGVLLTGCNIREDNTDCPRPFRLFIKALDADGKDITDTGEVERAVLFAFNEKQEVVFMVELTADQVRSRKPVNVHLDYPGHQSLTFVVWGNLDDQVQFPPHASVKQWNDLYAKLISQNGTAQSPGAVFYGNLTVPVEYGGLESAGDQTVEITHRTGQVTITAIELMQWNSKKEGKYEFRLKDSHDTCDKDGKHSGSAVQYLPSATMDANGTLKTPIFNTYPHAANETYELEILFNGQVIYAVTVGTDGTPFKSELGRVLNIIIDFRAGLSVKAVITPWNVVYQFVEI